MSEVVEHLPVLKEECLDVLNVQSGGVYVDCTVGGGGHAEGILERSAPTGRLIGLDRDPEAIVRAGRRLKRFARRVRLLRGNFRDFPDLMSRIGVERVDGVLIDLGVSMFQLEIGSRGFSFRLDAPLDMRMDQTLSIPTAGDLVNDSDPERLKQILLEYGEEKRWSRIVNAILRAREKRPIRTTRELAVLVEKALPGAERERIHPATRTFQALRIAVNDELNALREGLSGVVGFLKPGGRLGVISFHSLEDRIVKHFFRAGEKGCTCPPSFPVCTCGKVPNLKRVTGRPIIPGQDEIRRNPSSRSARLRAVIKIREAR